MGQAQALHFLQVSLAQGKLDPGSRIRYDVDSEGRNGLGCRTRGVMMLFGDLGAHRKFLGISRSPRFGGGVQKQQPPDFIIYLVVYARWSC